MDRFDNYENTVIYYLGNPISREQYLKLLENKTIEFNPYISPIMESKKVIQVVKCRYCGTKNKLDGFNCNACGAPL